MWSVGKHPPGIHKAVPVQHWKCCLSPREVSRQDEQGWALEGSDSDTGTHCHSFGDCVPGCLQPAPGVWVSALGPAAVTAGRTEQGSEAASLCHWGSADRLCSSLSAPMLVGIFRHQNLENMGVTDLPRVHAALQKTGVHNPAPLLHVPPSLGLWVVYDLCSALKDQ